MAIASFTAGVMSDEESFSAAIPASYSATDTPAALATSAKAPLLTATGNNAGNFTAPALPSPALATTASPATEVTNSADDSIALLTATPTNLPSAASAPAATTSPVTKVTNSAGDSITLRTATLTVLPVASAPAATTSPATPTVEAQEATPPAPTLTPQRNTNASATDTIGLAADSISKTHALTNTQPTSNTATPVAQSNALPTQTALQNGQSATTPQAEDSQALLPTTGQNAPPKTGASPRARYFAIGLILLMLAGGALAVPDKQKL